MDWGIFRPSRPTAMCLVLLAFSFLLMTFRLTTAVQTFRAFLFYWISPTQETATSSVKFAAGLGMNLAELVRAHRENIVLREKMTHLSLIDAQYEEMAAENRRLKGLLDLKSSLLFDAIPASVSGRDAQSWTQAVWIDRGIKEGVAPDCPVLAIAPGSSEDHPAAAGVIGRILESGSNSSKVLLISDPISSVAATLPRTGEQGLVRGQGSFQAMMEDLDPLASIEPGDQVVTSGIGGVFPEGLPIGELVRIIPSPSGFMRAEIRPFVSINKIREVLVVRKEKRKEIPHGEDRKP